MGAAICSWNFNTSQISFPIKKRKSTTQSTARLLPGGSIPVWKDHNLKAEEEFLSTSSCSDQTDLPTFIERLSIKSEPITKFYKLGKIVGLSFSTIIREGYDLQNFDRKVSIRTIEWDSIFASPEEYMDVIGRQKKVDHPNIWGVEEYFRDKDFLYIITETSDGPYLKEFISNNNLGEEWAVVIIHQLLDSVRYLNSLGFEKNNITVNNIRIDPNSLEIKLENFDLPYQFKGQKSKFIDYSSNSRITRKNILDDLHSIGTITSKICSDKDEITLDFINRCWGDSKEPRLSVAKAFDHGFFYFRSSQKQAYDESTLVIWNLSSVHDLDCSCESSVFLF